MQPEEALRRGDSDHPDDRGFRRNGRRDTRGDIDDPAASAMPDAVAHPVSGEVKESSVGSMGDVGEAVPPEIPLAPLKRLQARFNPLADGGMYLAVFLGGFLGAALRSPLAMMFSMPADDSGAMIAPYAATLTVNVAACFLYGLVSTYLSRMSGLSRRRHRLLEAGVVLGLCGSFSVMAMLMLQGFMMLRSGRIMAFFGYMLLCFCLGALALVIGNGCGNMVPVKRRSGDADARKIAESATSAMTPDVCRCDGNLSMDDGNKIHDAPVVNEPAPITAELSVVPNPTTGEVR